jgi:APA family basic amino acid/polyamine antiporter
MPTDSSLKRSLNLPAVTLYGVGAILGAGIYVLIGEIAGQAGYYAPLSFVLAAIIATFSAFSYAELSARFPRSAGEAVYIDEAFGRRYLTCLIGLLVIFTGIVSAATMATGLVGYFQLYIDWSAPLIITLFVVTIGAIAIWGIDEAAWIVMIITLLEAGGLLFIVFISADQFQLSLLTEFNHSEPVDGTVISGILLGSFLAFFAFIGFEDMVNIAEEIKQPQKVLPKAILLALTIATLLYIVVIYAALSVLPPEQLAASTAPLADVAMAQGYPVAWIGLISIIAVVNGAIVQLIMASRVIYGMASSRLLPEFLGQVNSYTSTPVQATVLCIGITLLLALLFPVASLAQATSIIVLSVFTMVNLALIRINSLRVTSETIHYPVFIPYIGAMLCIAMLIIKAVYFIS